MATDKQVKAIGADGVPYGNDEWVNTPLGVLGLVIATVVTNGRVVDSMVLIEGAVMIGPADIFTRAVSEEEEEEAERAAQGAMDAMKRDR